MEDNYSLTIPRSQRHLTLRTVLGDHAPGTLVSLTILGPTRFSHVDSLPDCVPAIPHGERHQGRGKKRPDRLK